MNPKQTKSTKSVKSVKSSVTPKVSLKSSVTAKAPESINSPESINAPESESVNATKGNTGKAPNVFNPPKVIKAEPRLEEPEIRGFSSKKELEELKKDMQANSEKHELVISFSQHNEKSGIRNCAVVVDKRELVTDSIISKYLISHMSNYISTLENNCEAELEPQLFIDYINRLSRGKYTTNIRRDDIVKFCRILGVKQKAGVEILDRIKTILSKTPKELSLYNKDNSVTIEHILNRLDEYDFSDLSSFVKQSILIEVQKSKVPSVSDF